MHVAYSEVLDKDAFYRALSSVICLKVKENIPIDYVVALLFSKEIKEQLMAMVSGTIINNLDPHLLSKVIVPKPVTFQSFILASSTVILPDPKVSSPL